jgi:hypothetical protein
MIDFEKIAEKCPCRFNFMDPRDDTVYCSALYNLREECCEQVCPMLYWLRAVRDSAKKPKMEAPDGHR